MNKELKDKWIAALRSGKYKQAKKRLRTGEDSFCCLGVLCDVVQPASWHRGGNAGVVSFGFGEMGLATTALPDPLAKKMGMGSAGHFRVASLPEELQDRVRQFVGETTASSLAMLNDSGARFELIADVIQAEPTWLR